MDVKDDGANSNRQEALVVWACGLVCVSIVWAHDGQ